MKFSDIKSFLAEQHVEPVSKESAKEIGDSVGVDWDEVDLEQFRMGLEVEQEHAATVGCDQTTIAKIALDHLAELPDYYTRLKKMESHLKEDASDSEARAKASDKERIKAAIVKFAKFQKGQKVKVVNTKNPKYLNQTGVVKQLVKGRGVVTVEMDDDETFYGWVDFDPDVLEPV